MADNINHTVQNNLCTGCGICEDICPKHCIKIVLKDGELRPLLDESLCLGYKCGRCLKVCPGVGINLVDLAKQQYDNEGTKEDKYIGRYVGIHTGYSLDNDIRYHSASGGMVSQFLIYLLDKKIIDGAVVTGFDEKDRITPVSYIARTREDILNARSSKYCPVALNKVGNDICQQEGRFVIVGLPCHIQGFRKRAKIDRRFRECVLGYFSIYCSSGRTFYGRDYIFKHYGVDKNKINYFAFRDHGCLGYLTVKVNDKPDACKKIPYSHYYGPMLRSFFKPHRCLTCIDHYGELADVCFGDIHIAPYSEDKVGISSWITRTEYWEEVFRHAAEEGYIKMDSISAKTLNDSQAAMLYPKKRRAQVVANIDKLRGRQIPRYDKPFDAPNLKDYVSEIVCIAQRVIGNNKKLWWIIDLLNRGK